MRRRLARSRQIAEVLPRNGLRALAVESGLSAWLPSTTPVEEEQEVRPELLVRVLRELGTTFIKFGRMLAARRDVLPPEYCDALETLTDSTPPTPAPVIRGRIEDELGDAVDVLFPEFDDEPLGSASVGQVHAATRLDGEQVVVKVREPGVAESVADDLALMESLVRALVRNNSALRELGLVGMVESFGATLRAEIDFTTEARACEETADLFVGDDTVHITWIDRTLTTSRVVTQERVGGLRLDDPAAITGAGLEPAVVGRTSVDALMGWCSTSVRSTPIPMPGMSSSDRTDHWPSREYLERQLDPEGISEWMQGQVSESIAFAHDLPARLERILDRFESGEIDLTVRDDVIESSVRHLDRTTNRLGAAMLTSAAVIAGAILYATRSRKRH